MTIKNTLGASLKAWRRQRKLTQEQLAAKVGITWHAISHIERGVNFPTVKTIEKLSAVLEIPIIEFYNLNNSMKNENCKKEEIIKQITGILHQLEEPNLEIILKQIEAFKKK